MRQLMRLATAFAAGAMTMYMLDPVAGRRRRAVARDKAASAGREAGELARGASKHAADRLHGAAAEMRARAEDAPVGDQQLHDRIRSQLGRLVDQPGKVDVHVAGGRVVLTGSAKPSEIEGLVAAVNGMQGVAGVDNRLGSGQGAPGSQSHH